MTNPTANQVGNSGLAIGQRKAPMVVATKPYGGIFRRLPLELESGGSVRMLNLHGGDPFTLAQDERQVLLRQRDRQHAAWRAQAGVRLANLDPLARVGSGWATRIYVDHAKRQVAEARLSRTRLFEVEPLLLGRAPTDALHLAGRACGKDSLSHMLAATQALEMAYAAIPPPLVTVTRNLAQSAEVLANALHNLFLLSGPDFGAAVVQQTTPQLWRKAQSTAAAQQEWHGCRTIADLMQGLDLRHGHFYQEAWQMLRTAREIIVILLGKYPHPTALLPAGVGLEIDKETFNLVFGRVNQLVDYAKRVVAVWNDVLDFFYNVEPRYRLSGEIPTNLLSLGQYDDPDFYDAAYSHCGGWGTQRLLTPGAVIFGQLRTVNLAEINIGIEEFIDHSYYAPWPAVTSAALIHATDPLQVPLSQYHPWNKETLPHPGVKTGATIDWETKYSWLTAPRWDREAVETGPLARLWVMTLAARQQHEFVRANGRTLEIALPQVNEPAVHLVWQPPERPNPLERQRARAHEVALHSVLAFMLSLKALDYVRRADALMSEPYRVPAAALGIGFQEGGSGLALHHLEIGDQRLVNYQLSTAANWLGSPRCALGMTGVVEESLQKTLLLEEFNNADEFTGIDLQRTLRSFDL